MLLLHSSLRAVFEVRRYRSVILNCWPSQQRIVRGWSNLPICRISVHLFLRTLLVRPDLAACVRTLKIAANDSYRKNLPVLLDAFNTVELALLKNLAEWTDTTTMLRLGSVEAICFAVLRLSHPITFSFESNTSQAFLNLPCWLERNKTMVHIKELTLSRIKTQGGVGRLLHLKNLQLTIDVPTVMKIQLEWLRAARVSSLYVQELSLHGYISMLFMPQLVKLHYIIWDTPQRLFSMSKFITNGLYSSRDTLEWLNLDYGYEPFPEDRRGSLLQFTRLRHAVIPVALTAPMEESMPPNVECLIFHDGQKHAQSESERARTFGQVSRCALSNTKEVIYTFFDHITTEKCWLMGLTRSCVPELHTMS
jgi:hypothetical protein